MGMDPRVREHAAVVVEHCCDVSAEDNVVIGAPSTAEDLVVALYERLGERGARPALHWSSARAGRAYARAMNPDDYRTAEHRLAEMEETDVVIMIGGSHNTAEQSDVSAEMGPARSRAHEPILQERLEKQWVLTQHPTTGNAQKAEMSTEAYEDFVYRAVNKDWDEQREFQAQLVEVLDPANEVHIVSGDSTDLTISVEGMHAVNDNGKLNLPGGEVFTAPVPDSVEGEVHFDKPLVRYGREIQDVRLTFEKGKVITHEAAKNEDLLTSVLDTDDGARRLGELGIGMNRDIDRFSYNMLFDEKMGDTIHLALGDAIDECVPEEMEANESAQHVDMIVDMSENSKIEVDGEVVQRDGTFRFEDGFEG